MQICLSKCDLLRPFMHERVNARAMHYGSCTHKVIFMDVVNISNAKRV